MRLAQHILNLVEKLFCVKVFLQVVMPFIIKTQLREGARGEGERGERRAVRSLAGHSPFPP